ncbi:MAG: deoxyribose-phosphate aldolase [Lachnospiraceae bacterium]|nr:deoxyribose-phosphate aldolase [Lachnospiraceae bacterium]
MTDKEILSHVDYTLLKPTATWEDIKKLCDGAVRYKTASVCVPPCYVSRIKKEYGDSLNICTVIGFPLGYSVTESKVTEAETAVKEGASEIDMVVNVNFVKNGEFDLVTREIEAIKKACSDRILKVIIETCYLTEEEKIRLCQCVTDAKADYIKTSTGFGTQGATFEDVKLFAANIGKDVKIKAAGGVRTKEAMEEYLKLGADRIGASNIDPLILNQ